MQLKSYLRLHLCIWICVDIIAFNILKSFFIFDYVERRYVHLLCD